MQQPQFSVIVPVYNRPDEVDELLFSLSNQTNKNFEVIVVEDGSKINCVEIVEKYKNLLNLVYKLQENTGPAEARNHGASLAKGDFFIFFDSDCIIPENYFEIVSNELLNSEIQAFGGPDRAHPNFTHIQKAINYSMTSFLTTGGIRGGKKKMDKFYPRSFNMGISRNAFITTKGFANLRFGEDVDFSLRLVENGFNTALIENAYVYHKRRTDLKKFYKQVFNSGTARISLYKLHPNSLKLVHLLPSLFVLSIFVNILISILIHPAIFLIYFLLYLLLAIDSVTKNKNIKVALLSGCAGFVQLIGYGNGFFKAVWKGLILKKTNFYGFKNNFYK